jgi:ankyrin repeat protein
MYQLESLLISGSNVESRNANGDSPKSIAKRIGNEEIQSLIENGVGLVNTEDRRIIAKRIGYEDIQFLIENTDNRGIITKRMGYEGIQSLIEDSVNTENSEGETPLFTASRNRYGGEEQVKWLISKGAYVNTKNKSHEVDLCLGVKRNVLVAKPKLYTALMVAQDIETIKALIRAGADLNVQASDGNTALMLYTKYDWFSGVKELIYAGADANLTNKWFETALIIAKRSYKINRVGSTELIALLQENTTRKFVPFILSPLFFIFKSEYDY